MRTDRPLLFAGLAVALLVLPARAHVGERVYPIYELPTSALPDLHDGTLDDWKAVLPGPSLDSGEFPGLSAFDPVLGQASLSFRVWLAWHHVSQRLFVAAEWVDDVFWSPYAGVNGSSGRQHSDGFDILLDGDHSGGQYWPTYTMFDMSDVYTGKNKLISCVQAQDYGVVFRAADGTNAGLYGPLRDFWLNHPPYMDMDGFVTDGATVTASVEVALTAWDHLNIDDAGQSVASRLVAGAIIGFDFVVWDWDGPANPGDARGYMLLGTVDQVNSSGFKDAELVPCDQEDCSGASDGSFVDSDSWARIKARSR
ncbi:MAG: hypothetical protein WDA75_22240 [Candidatus Latescibacterota bacterium]|jgi:hypothetical protein